MIRRPFDAKWVQEQLNMGIPVIAEGTDGGWIERFFIKEYDPTNNIYVSTHLWYENEIDYNLIILPPLPHHPKLEDIQLLYRYGAENLSIIAKGSDGQECHNTAELILSIASGTNELEVTHATDTNGRCIEVAISPTIV